ncbi:AlbA family DNA-binding domain-containing protein [Iodobacter fluviatilis]|uniref:ATP-binding protein n=1 Tax=Iodobacter fluviatilis TaxID=537 RepID=A0A7G3G7J2_9NEIS|nr:ATP-binding protein [Iodobacter fluviatilis]QBC43003.1 ATP-binding protein [Iodobacter fluviatilis]
MLSELLTTLRYKSEGTDIDFKSSQYRFSGGTEDDKSEMLKDILAIANAWRDGSGYILLGFKEKRPHPAEVVGISTTIDDAQIQQFVNSKVKPKLTFCYEEHLYEGKTVGIITIPKQKRPFYTSHTYGKVKSNVVYVRRGSSTDEAEPPEATEMSLADSGRGNMRVDMSVLTPGHEVLPDSFERFYMTLTEEFPDYVSQRPSSYLHGISSSYDIYQQDNKAYWRELARYTRINDQLILLQFLLVNRSEVQLSSAKLEVFIEPLDGQGIELIAKDDLPEKPSAAFNIMNSIRPLSEVLIGKNAQFIVNDNDLSCGYVRFGSLLPGEEGKSSLLAIIPQGPGRLRIRFRILGGELAEPIEREQLIEAVGNTETLDFKGFQSFYRERLIKERLIQGTS